MRQRVVFIGRFNPFHNGHLSVIHEILGNATGTEAEDEVTMTEMIIAIGSAQESHSSRNPFTAGERIEMIHAALIEAKLPLDRFFLIPIQDIQRNAIWVTHVRSLCPSFDRVITNNSLSAHLFREAGCHVVNPPLKQREILSGTEVRRRIVEGEDWRSLLPKAVSDFIEAVGGVARIKEIAKNDVLIEGSMVL